MGATTEAPPAEQVQADQEAMEAARVEVREETDGQLAIGGPGTEPKFSTDAGGYPPTSAELALKSKKVPWENDLDRGAHVLLLVWAYIDDIVVGAKKILPAEVLRLVDYQHPELKPGEVIQALDDLRARTERDRAVIDQAAQLAQDVLESDPATTGIELAETIREQLYKLHRIDDDAHEVTHGTEDHLTTTTERIHTVALG